MMKWWCVVVAVAALMQQNAEVQSAPHQRDLDETLRELRMLLRDAELSEPDVREVDDDAADSNTVDETEPVPGEPLVVPTFGGNARGANCAFPFHYNGEEHTTCITRWNEGILWCATTYNYTNDKQWGNCEAVATFGGNSEDGSLCRFPFEYKGVTYPECTTAGNDDILWCYTTGGNWGNCRAIRTSGGNAEGATCAFPFNYLGETYSSCTADGSVGVEWCATTRDYDADGEWGYCGDVATLGGNANGSYCEFPYTYKGELYTSCTAAGNGGVPWCATTSNYDADLRWGNCRVGGCGYRPIVQEGDRIVGGFDAIYGAFPWTATIPYKTSNGYSRWCGGTIINDRWILTAAHCFWGDSASEYLALISNQFYSRADQYEQILQLELLITHEQYQGSPYDYDIALIRVDGRIYFNNYSQAACLPEEGADVYQSGAIGIISGWGSLTQGGWGPDQLNAAEVPLVDEEWCANRFSTLTDRMVCAGYLQGGVDTCQGDSGGPMVQNISDVYTVTGVTSWGAGCAQEESPGVYARVQEFLSWINQTMANNP